MQNLEKRIALLECRRGTSLEALTDDELDARIAHLNSRAVATDEINALIAKLKTELSNEREAHYAEH